MRILLVTDAWEPQINGVVRTWQNVRRELEERGHTFKVICPALFNTMPLPRYSEIHIALLPGRKVARMMRQARFDAVHLPTEGPLGMAARRYCVRNHIPFTTSYHTQLPHYLHRYCGMPTRLTYKLLRWFHGRAKAVLVPTRTVGQELEQQGFRNVVVWSRGVNLDTFNRLQVKPYDLPRPIFIYAGRVAIEKNIEAFLELDLPGSKVVVGDGPAKVDLEKRFPGVHFAGYQFGRDLAAHYAGADVFVFPSKTDTFGVVMLEANACGLPVAALPVTGPIDVVQNGKTGCLNPDLRQACLDALTLDRETCVQYARQNSWARCAQILLDNLATVDAIDLQPAA